MKEMQILPLKYDCELRTVPPRTQTMHISPELCGWLQVCAEEIELPSSTSPRVCVYY